jgi:hypothetical protein
MKRRRILVGGVVAASAMAAPALSLNASRRSRTKGRYALKLNVSETGRYLVREDDSPFFYLGDTAWELFHRLNREDADRYLRDRAAKGFTVIQAVALAELDGPSDPNAYGHLPLVDLDPARPAVIDGPENDYWDHVDDIVDRANELGLVIGFLPTWGRYWHDAIRDGQPLFTPDNAETYGEWLGRRYRDKDLIWILGGGASRPTSRSPSSGQWQGDCVGETGERTSSPFILPAAPDRRKRFTRRSGSTSTCARTGTTRTSARTPRPAPITTAFR